MSACQKTAQTDYRKFTPCFLSPINAGVHHETESNLYFSEFCKQIQLNWTTLTNNFCAHNATRICQTALANRHDQIKLLQSNYCGQNYIVNCCQIFSKTWLEQNVRVPSLQTQHKQAIITDYGLIRTDSMKINDEIIKSYSKSIKSGFFITRDVPDSNFLNPTGAGYLPVYSASTRGDSCSIALHAKVEVKN